MIFVIFASLIFVILLTSFAGVRTDDGDISDYDVTDVNDNWAEMLNISGNKELGKSNLLGKTITHIYAETTVGCCAWRLRRGETTMRSGLGVSAVATQHPGTSQHARLTDPFTVEDTDSLELFTVATPT